MDSAWIKDVCLAWEGNDPSELLENLMAHEQCPAFGPIHHALVGRRCWPALGRESTMPPSMTC